MKLDGCRELAVQKVSYSLPKYLTSPIPLKYLLSPLIIRMIVCHVLSLDSVPSHNADCTMATTFCQLVASGVSYQVTEINH